MAATRCIAHFDLDAFFVSVERLKNPELVGKPLIVGGSVQRGEVSACSYETRKFGIHSAMPMHQAMKLCPDAIVVKGSMGSYSDYSNRVTSIICQEMPLVQKASIDEFYIDMTGMHTFFNPFEHARSVKQRIMTEVGLPVSFALASSKIISKIATNECKPNGEIEVLPGTEKAFLSPLAVDKIPMVGNKTAIWLKSNHIYTIGDLLKLTHQEICKLLGNGGISLLNRLNGNDETPVRRFRQKKSISSENTFYQNTNDEAFLINELVRLIEKVGRELREERKQATCLGIKIKYHDFQVKIHQCQMNASAYDHVFIKVVKDLFRQLYMKGKMVRLIGVRLSNLQDAAQKDIFEVENNSAQLYNELDKLKSVYGTTIINRASSVIAYQQEHTRPNNQLWYNRNI